MISEGMRDRARELRADATVFEQAFWACVRAKRLGGFKFRRQQVIGGYVVDFACMEARLVVELDGDWHQCVEQRAYDVVRDEWLQAQGYRVLRIRNREWAMNQAGVLMQVLRELQGGTHHEAFSSEVSGSSPPHEVFSLEMSGSSPHPQPLSPNGRGALEEGAVDSVHSLAPLPQMGGGAGGEGVLIMQQAAAQSVCGQNKENHNG